MTCKALKRLTMDNPKGDYDRLMNYAYAKENRAHLSYAGGKYDVDLCEYVSDLAKAKGYDFSPEFIMEDGLLDNFDDDFAILYYCAVQAAELRERLKLYEDKLEEGKLIELPCKVGDTVYYLGGHYERHKTKVYVNKVIKSIVDHITIGQKGVPQIDVCNDENAWTTFDCVDDFGKIVFLTREEAEKKLEELRE